MREGAELWKGKIATLKRFKDDVSEVRQGVECGIDLAGYKDIQIGDIIEAFTTENSPPNSARTPPQPAKPRKPKRNAKPPPQSSRNNRRKLSQRLTQFINRHHNT